VERRPAIESSPGAGRSAPGPLPNVLIIGAMKCGTSALHRLLAAHPEVSMAAAKELNFFVGPARVDGDWSWSRGNWHRGVEWYARQFAEAPVRGEASPAYTSPSFPEAAGRIARVVPDVRLVYLVRDPVARAVSQYRHHHRDGTERRPLAEALLDPASQYLSRSRFHARLTPFLDRFRREQIFVCAQEELLRDRRATLRALHEFLGVVPGLGAPHVDAPPDVRRGPALPAALHARIGAELVEDAIRIRELAGRDFPGWSV
jgi:hypothetical protein